MEPLVAGLRCERNKHKGRLWMIVGGKRNSAKISHAAMRGVSLFFSHPRLLFFRPQDVCQAPLGAAWALPLSPFDYISGVVPLFSWRGDFSTKSLIFFFFYFKIIIYSFINNL